MPDITTDPMTARTESMVRAAVPLRPAHVHTPRQWSQQARATRSLRLASRITDPVERRAALAQHFEEFMTARACPVHRT